MKRLPSNVTPFKLDGWPLDALDQTAMVEIRKLADQTGWTVAEVIREVTQEYVARRQAETTCQPKFLSSRDVKLAESPLRVLQTESTFHRRAQHNVSVIAMCVRHKDCLSARINR